MGTYSNAVWGDVNGLIGRRRGSGMMKSSGRSRRRRIRRKMEEVLVVSESCPVQSKASNHWSCFCFLPNVRVPIHQFICSM